LASTRAKNRLELQRIFGKIYGFPTDLIAH